MHQNLGGLARSHTSVRGVPRHSRPDDLLATRWTAEDARAVERTVRRYVADRMIAEEVWADVALLAFQRDETLRALSPDRRRAWLLTAARYLAMNAARRAARDRAGRTALAASAADPWTALAPSPEDELASRDRIAQAERDWAVVKAALRALSSDDREMLSRHARGDRSPVIGADLGISAGAVRKRLMRARAALRAEYVRLATPT